MMIDPGKIKDLSRKYASKILEIRRHLHEHPELSFKEYNTSAYIQSRLKEAGIPFKNGYVETGIVAMIEGNGKKTILLRADMDALPIDEKNEVPYRSKNPGVMHACGHDAHSACALGAAFILNELKNDIKGNVKIMFQPGEEVLPGGASLMIKAGVLEEPRTWEYGERSCLLEDLGGHRWELTQTMRDVEAEEWGGITVAPW